MPDRRDIGRLAIKGIITSAYSLASLLALGLPGPAEAPKHGSLRSTFENPKSSTPNETSDLDSPQYKRVQRHLAEGWNTWDVNSVTTHVLLPEGLAIHVGLQHNSTEDSGAFLEDAIEGRRTRDSEQLALGPHSWNGSYTDLQVSWKSHRWRIQSAHIGKDLVLLASPLSSSSQPTLIPTIVFSVNFLWHNSGTTIRRLGYIEAQGPSSNVAIYCTCTRSPAPRGLDGSGNPLTGGNTDFLVKSPYFAMQFTRPLGISTGKQRSLAEIEAILYQQNAIRQKSIVAGDAAASIEDAIQTTLGWNTIYDPDNHRVITPVGRNWSAANGGYVLFEWDTMFTATMASSGDRNLAYANVIEILRGERPEGFIPNYTRAGHHEVGDQQTSDRSQPPIGSITVLGLYEKFHDRWLLEQAFQPLLNWNRWWPSHRDMEGYLTWGSDGKNQPVDITDHSRGARQGAIYESGMDNSPMYANAQYNSSTGLLEFADVGLMSMYVSDCEALATIADILGKHKEAADLRDRGSRYRAKLGTMWSDRDGIFLNRDLSTGEFNHRLSPTNFYPLLARAATPQQADRMIKEHLLNEDEFWGPWVLPSIARDDPAFKSQIYWSGRIWGPMNYLVYLGLRNYDHAEVRKALAQRSARLYLKEWAKSGHTYENYNAITGTGEEGARDDLYNWGALLGYIEYMDQTDLPAP